MLKPPAPIRFNPLKHHLSTMRSHLIHCANEGENVHLQRFVRELKTSKGVVDVYDGPSTVHEIAEEVLDHLQREKIKTRAEFCDYLERAGAIKRRGHYVNLIVAAGGPRGQADESLWTLREGEDDVRFVHLHPARRSKHVFRVHGNALAAAILGLFLAHCRDAVLDLDHLNEGRRLLGLCPVPRMPEATARVLERLVP